MIGSPASPGTLSRTTPSSAISSARQSITSPTSTWSSFTPSAISRSSGRKQWPWSLLCDSAYCSPAFTRSGLSCGMPTDCAIRSAVRNPMPQTSEASRYGSFLTTPIEPSPYFLKIRTASEVETPTPCRKTITSLMDFCSSQAAAIILVRFGPRPGTSISRFGCCSITSRVSTPNCSTIRSANRGPIPLISPDPRYRWMPWMVAGSTVV